MSIKRKDNVFTDEAIIIHLSRSTTDQYHRGSEIFIAKNTTPFCPVSVCARFLKMLGDPMDGSMPVVRCVVRTKHGM